MGVIILTTYPYLNWLNESMTAVDYPQKTVDFVTASYKKICDNERANKIFHTPLALYEKQLCPAWNWGLAAAERAGNLIDLHVFSAKFVFSLCATKHIKTFYKQKGMPDGCFDGFLNDIKIKWSECVTVHKMDGVFVAEWFGRFADGTRHTFGRLQYEPIILGNNYQTCGITLSEGDMVVNVHIPGGSKLLKQDCIASFLKAAEFYAPFFENGEVIFHCDSWLLYPGHKEFLPETSALLMFADFFSIVETNDWRGNLWRIFGRENCDDVAALPEDTSLQRAYKKRLLENGEIGGARGFFFIKGNEFIK